MEHLSLDIHSNMKSNHHHNNKILLSIIANLVLLLIKWRGELRNHLNNVYNGSIKW